MTKVIDDNIYILYLINTIGRLEEMDEWLMVGHEDPFALLKEYIEEGDPSFVGVWQLSKRLKKKKMNLEEEMEYYNIDVYKMLPYPPHTKELKDFFILRT